MMNSRKRRAEGAWWRRGKRAGIAAFGHRRDGHSGLPSRLALAAGRRYVFDRFPPPPSRCPSCDKETLSTRGRRSCCSRPPFVLLAAAGSATRGRESMTCKAFREKESVGAGQKLKKNLRGFEPNSKWRSMRT